MGTDFSRMHHHWSLSGLLLILLIAPQCLVNAGMFLYGRQHLPSWMNTQALSSHGADEEYTESLNDQDSSPRTSPLMMKRPSPSQIETLKRLYNVEMVRRLSGGGGLFDMTYLSDQAKHMERQQQQQLEENKKDALEDAPRSSQALRLPKGPVMPIFGLTSPYISVLRSN